MPDVVSALDDDRWAFIRHQSMLAANLWLNLAVAAERKQKADAFLACQAIQARTKAVFPIVKRLGNPEPDDNG